MFKKIHEAKVGESLLFSGVNGSRDFLRVGQIDNAISSLANLQFDGVVNIGTGKATQLYAAIRYIAQILGREDLTLKAVDDQPTSHIAETTKLNSLGICLEPQVENLLADLARKHVN